MALETLVGINEIGGFKIEKIVKNPDAKVYIGKYWPIVIDNDNNTISFKLQLGPIKENGVNGCQVDTMIEAAKLIIEGLNKQFPCRENAMVITKLDEALMWSNKRKQDRINRNVEGFNKE
jgi:hypothetical protein